LRAGSRQFCAASLSIRFWIAALGWTANARGLLAFYQVSAAHHRVLEDSDGG
jgi:hypothetical protein